MEIRCPFYVTDPVIFAPIYHTDIGKMDIGARCQFTIGNIYTIARILEDRYLTMQGYENTAGPNHWWSFWPAPNGQKGAAPPCPYTAGQEVLFSPAHLIDLHKMGKLPDKPMPAADQVYKISAINYGNYVLLKDYEYLGGGGLYWRFFIPAMNPADSSRPVFSAGRQVIFSPSPYADIDYLYKEERTRLVPGRTYEIADIRHDHYLVLRGYEDFASEGIHQRYFTLPTPSM